MKNRYLTLVLGIVLSLFLMGGTALAVDDLNGNGIPDPEEIENFMALVKAEKVKAEAMGIPEYLQANCAGKFIGPTGNVAADKNLNLCARYVVLHVGLTPTYEFDVRELMMMNCSSANACAADVNVKWVENAEGILEPHTEAMVSELKPNADGILEMHFLRLSASPGQGTIKYSYSFPYFTMACDQYVMDKLRLEFDCVVGGVKVADDIVNKLAIFGTGTSFLTTILGVEGRDLKKDPDTGVYELGEDSIYLAQQLVQKNKVDEAAMASGVIQDEIRRALGSDLYTWDYVAGGTDIPVKATLTDVREYFAIEDLAAIAGHTTAARKLELTKLDTAPNTTTFVYTNELGEKTTRENELIVTMDSIMFDSRLNGESLIVELANISDKGEDSFSDGVKIILNNFGQDCIDDVCTDRAALARLKKWAKLILAREGIPDWDAPDHAMFKHFRDDLQAEGDQMTGDKSQVWFDNWDLYEGELNTVCKPFTVGQVFGLDDLVGAKNNLLNVYAEDMKARYRIEDVAHAFLGLMRTLSDNKNLVYMEDKDIPGTYEPVFDMNYKTLDEMLADIDKKVKEIEINQDTKFITDPDGDGIASCIDNCPDDANEGQSDKDGDGKGDACDPCPEDPKDLCEDPGGECEGVEYKLVDGCCIPCDPAQEACYCENPCTEQNDGVCDDVDNCPIVYNPDQTDTDGNGVGDACEDRI